MNRKEYSYTKRVNNFSQSNSKIIHTIGYGGAGNDPFKSVLLSLKKNKINSLVDVRINPFCSFDKRLSKFQLKHLLEKSKITYYHYTELGNIFKGVNDGEILYENLFRKSGDLLTTRLRKIFENEKNNVVLLCSCGNYKFCHRNVISGFLMMEYGYKAINLTPTSLSSNNYY